MIASVSPSYIVLRDRCRMWASNLSVCAIISFVFATHGRLTHNMHALSLEFLRTHLDEAVSMAARDALIITRDNGRNIVMMSEANWRSLQKIVHLLSTPLNAARLKQSIEDSRDKR